MKCNTNSMNTTKNLEVTAMHPLDAALLHVHFSKAPESTIFNRSRSNLDEAQLPTLVYACIKFKAPAQFLHTKLACTKCLASEKS